MDYQDVMNRLFQEVMEMVRLLKERPDDLVKNLTPEVAADILRLKKELEHFREENKDLFEGSKERLKDLEKWTHHSQVPLKSDNETLQKILDMKRTVRQLKKDFSNQIGHKEQPGVESQAESKQKRKRRNTFKSIGGDEKWMVL